MQSSCSFSICKLTLHETFLVPQNGVHESHMFVLSWIVTVETTLVHPELHVGLVLCLAVNYEHKVVAVAGDPMLLDDIAECNCVGDGSFAEPNTLVVTRHRRLVGHQHGAPVAPKSHGLAQLEGLVH